MSTLTELVTLRNNLKSVAGNLSMEQAIMHCKETIRNAAEQQGTEYRTDILRVISRYNSIEQLANSSIAELNGVIKKIELEIQSLVNELDTAEYRDNFSVKNYHTRQLILKDFSGQKGVQLGLTDALTKNNWKWPGLITDPQYQGVVNAMIGMDPLYIAETLGKKQPDDYTKHFHKKYQNKICYYGKGHDVDGVFDFGQLPSKQFGLVLCWDFFNYVNLNELENWLKKIIPLLRPGGSIFISYNNADLENTAHHIDTGTFAYASPGALTRIATRLKFDHVKFKDLKTNSDVFNWVSWAEFVWPGELSTIKEHMVIPRVRYKI